jgi:GNAT superfamily N-acetyltransferase
MGGPTDAAWINGFLHNRWGATTIVVHREVIEAATLPVLMAMAENRRGLATYRRLGRDAELVTLDADTVGVGTGAALVEALVARLRSEGCERLWLTTTNDKLSASGFRPGSCPRAWCKSAGVALISGGLAGLFGAAVILGRGAHRQCSFGATEAGLH